jgi:hypothetical protein
MGKTKGPHKEEFPKDSTVQIADRGFLENFLKTWKLHHELEPQQLNYASKIAKVKSVGFYHGGDEQCLRAVKRTGFLSKFFGQ